MTDEWKLEPLPPVPGAGALDPMLVDAHPGDRVSVAEGPVLHVFDGTAWQTHALPSSIGGSTRVHIDRAGAIWLAGSIEDREAALFRASSLGAPWERLAVRTSAWGRWRANLHEGLEAFDGLDFTHAPRLLTSSAASAFEDSARFVLVEQPEGTWRVETIRQGGRLVRGPKQDVVVSDTGEIYQLGQRWPGRPRVASNLRDVVLAGHRGDARALRVCIRSIAAIEGRLLAVATILGPPASSASEVASAVCASDGLGTWSVLWRGTTTARSVYAVTG